MNLTAQIISRAGKRLHEITITTASASLDRPTIKLAEDEVRDWAREHNQRVSSHIVSNGVYRAWVEPIPAGRLRTLAQLGRTA